MKNLFLGLLLILTLKINAQHNYANYVLPAVQNPIFKEDSVMQMTQVIRAIDMSSILHFLASDTCEGRELGQRGNNIAGDYIADYYTKLGIKKIGDGESYFQHVGFNWISWAELNVNANEHKYRQLWDFVCIPTENNSMKLNTKEIYFLGYGIDDKNYSDYKNFDVKGKTILIYKGEPIRKNGKSWITNSTVLSPWSNDLTLKIKTASAKGAKCILIIEDKFKELVEANRARIITPSIILDGDVEDMSQQANVFYLSSSMTAEILNKTASKVIKLRDKIKNSGKPQNLRINCDLKIDANKQVSSIQGRNIMAYIEGTDKKDEVIIISAHYDHIGIRGDEINNGADDNGSGTTAIMQIAKAFQTAKNTGKGPRRSILCLSLTGEEKGLLGSMYYVSKPVIPLSQTVADINIDMIGRVDDKYTGNPFYVYVIGSDRLSTELHEINEQTNKDYSNLTLDYTYNSENDPNRYYFRSDHYNFAQHGIPAIFFFNGTHADYHRPTDDVEKIDFVKMEHIARHAFALAWNLANRNERITVNVN